MTIFVIKNMEAMLLFLSYITDQTLLFASNDKSTPQVQEVLDDSPFFVREDGVSIMNGANEGMS